MTAIATPAVPLEDQLPHPEASGLIARRTLARRLVAAQDTSVALLVAPVGYGKSTLLAEWASADSRPFAWVRLGPADDGPQQLLRRVASALEPVAKSGKAAKSPARQVMTALSSPKDAFVLVIDNAEVLRDARAIEMLGRWIECLGPHTQIAIASRTEPALPVARLRTERRLVELREADLVFTRSEVARAAAAMDLPLDDRGADLLARRTEGWPAGIYLAGLAVAGDPQPLRALARFAGDDRLVADYLREEVLDGLSPRMIEFLARTSILERLSGPICDYVLERNDSARLLKQLSRMNVLVHPLDRTDTEYRYQALFAGALRSELRTHEPELEAPLHARASEWYEGQGDATPAIKHAIAAGELERAGRLVWNETPSLIAYGDKTTLTRWLTRFSREQIASCAPLALSAAIHHLVVGDRALAEHWTEAALRTQADGGAADESLTAAARLMRAALTVSDLVAMKDEAASAGKLAREDSPWRSLACLIEGTALHLTGDRREARVRLEEGARRGAAVAPAIQVLCLAQLALLGIDEHDWAAADVLAARARAQTERVGVGDCPTSALVFAVSAAVEGNFGRVEACEREAQRAARLLAKLDDFLPWFNAECRVALAWAALRRSEVPGALSLLADAERELNSVLGAIAVRDWLTGCRAQCDLVASSRNGDAEPLTTAELRVLQFLPTHLSFPEIADELFVSTNTVKTHARAVYRKLSASCRGEAVAHAREARLLDSSAHEVIKRAAARHPS